MGEKRNEYRILLEKPEGKRPLGRLRHRWVDNINITLKRDRKDGVDWIDLARRTGTTGGRALVNTVMFGNS
jgi:hypothetical protein